MGFRFRVLGFRIRGVGGYCLGCKGFSLVLDWEATNGL